MAMDYDGADKLIFELDEVMADLLRIAAPGWVDDLDVGQMTDGSAEYVSPPDAGGVRHRRRFGDMARRVPFRGGRLTDGQRRPYVVVLVEFQSSVDRSMARRLREYSEMQHERMWRKGVAEREGGLPWLLPVTFHNGARPWTGRRGELDLAPLPSLAATRDLALLQPQGYRFLDARALALDDSLVDNKAAAAARLQCSETPAALIASLLRERERFPGAANDSFHRALHGWADAMRRRMGQLSGFPTFDELEGGGAATMTSMLRERMDQWDAEQRAAGRAEGVEVGRAEGVEAGLQRGRAEAAARLYRQAALKFDDTTAERLAGLSEGLAASEGDRVGDWIIECATGDELLSRVVALKGGGR